jgi:hypothetical protein
MPKKAVIDAHRHGMIPFELSVSRQSPGSDAIRWWWRFRLQLLCRDCDYERYRCGVSLIPRSFSSSPCFICGIVTTSGTDLGIVTTTLVQGFTSNGESPGFVASSGQLLHLGWWSTAMSCCYPRRGLHTPSTPTYLEGAREQQGTTAPGKGASSSLSAAATTTQPSTHISLNPWLVGLTEALQFSYFV